MEDELIKKLDKIINKFIFESKKFIEYSAFPYAVVVKIVVAIP